MASKPTLDDFLNGKSELTVGLFHHFVARFRTVADVEVLPAKTMVGIGTPRKRVAYITQFGKNFITVVFPFDKAYPDNLCFEKIAQVPGDKQHNHYFRMRAKEDLNAEVMRFIKLAVKLAS